MKMQIYQGIFMMPSLDSLFIPAQKTPYNQEELLLALVQAYSSLFQEQISFNSLGILYSHISLEVGHGKECYCYNLGNIRRTPNHLWTMYFCSEIINGKEIFYYPPDPGSQFNAYESLEQAAKEYVSFLLKPRYFTALGAMREGRYNDYTRLLKIGGYFTASLERYQTTFLKLFEEYQKKYTQWYQDRYQASEYLIGLPFVA